MSKPVISVIMTSYNNESYIGEAINSVLNQTFENFELIVVDDASNDKTDEIISNFSDSRLIYYKNANNQGFPAPNRNYGLEQAAGKYIALIDADDVWKKDKLEKQLELMKEYQIDAVCTNYIIKYERDQKLIQKKTYNNSFLVDLNTLLASNIIANSSILFRKSIINEIGNFCEDRNIIEDYDYWLRLAALKPNSILMHPEPLIYYRVHDEMTSKRDHARKWRMLKFVYENNKKYITSDLVTKRIEECDVRINEEMIKEKISKKQIMSAIRLMFTTNNHSFALYKRLFRRILRL
ncbi:MAG: glycosyltransferase family 2 protein [bacterium]